MLFFRAADCFVFKTVNPNTGNAVMNKRVVSTIIGSLILVLVLAGAGYAVPSIDDLNRLMDSTRIAEADVFAPKAYEKAAKKAAQAQDAVKRGKKKRTIEGYISEASEFAQNALKATEVAKLSLNEYLPPRNKAREAKAAMLVQVLYAKAEKQFMKATARIESGNVKGGLKEAEKATPLFEVAEMEAIRVDVLGNADKLIDAAVADGADKFALSTLDKARTALTKGNAILMRDRYNREEATVEARRAEYEARHASNIAQSVRSLARNDQAWEKLMLVYEIQMNRVGSEVDMGDLPFDRGPLAAADSLILYIRAVQEDNRQLLATQEEVTGKLKGTLEKLNYKSTHEDPVELAGVVYDEVAALKGEVAQLSDEVAEEKTRISELADAHEEVTAELEVRREQEAKFKKAKQILNPSEGDVLFNASNDIVLRLSGLSFDVGKSDIKDEHIPLLKKVEEVVGMFPESKLVVEGHTDSKGEPSANTLLSEKRAFAVMQYLRQSMLIPADRIKSIGYGADKPVASNQTVDGRAKNRRIDIVIMR